VVVVELGWAETLSDLDGPSVAIHFPHFCREIHDVHHFESHDQYSGVVEANLEFVLAKEISVDGDSFLPIHESQKEDFDLEFVVSIRRGLISLLHFLEYFFVVYSLGYTCHSKINYIANSDSVLVILGNRLSK
jgi:hypothetical protein